MLDGFIRMRVMNYLSYLIIYICVNASRTLIVNIFDVTNEVSFQKR